MTAFDSRIGYLPHEESASLRYCRGVVAEAHSDIVARLPGPTPPALSANSVFADGRDVGSRYPNFMLSSERVSYGI